jgi:hypothetical protein
MANTVIELQRGLEFYYEAQREFERREIPVDKMVAFGFEAGYQAGRAEALSEEALRLIRYPGVSGNFVSNGERDLKPASNYNVREWA